MGAAVARSQYSAEQIEAGLLELACWHGNVRQASRCLAERGLEIPFRTLQDWKRTHAERFQEIHSEVVPLVRARLAEQYEQIAARSAEIAIDGLERFSKELDEVPLKDLAGAIRNIGVTGAVGVDKASLLRGMPTEIRKSENVSDLVERVQETEKALREKYPGLFAEGTAEEIPDAEVVEEKAEGPAERQPPRTSSHANAQAQTP